jgi:hypothetical protein
MRPWIIAATGQGELACSSADSRCRLSAGGQTASFAVGAIAISGAWAVSGPAFHYSDTWSSTPAPRPSTPFGNRWKQRKRGSQRLPRISRRQKVASPEKARPFGREKMTILPPARYYSALGDTMPPPPQAREDGE